MWSDIEPFGVIVGYHWVKLTWECPVYSSDSQLSPSRTRETLSLYFVFMFVFIIKNLQAYGSITISTSTTGCSISMIPKSLMWSPQVLSYQLSNITVLWYGLWCICTLIKTDLRVSSVQCGLPSPAESSFTPESCRLLELRSSSLRLEELELRTEARASQHLSDRPQPMSLHTK